MKTILAIWILAFCQAPLGHAEEDTSSPKTITIRYVEGYQDVTVLGRIYAIFQSEDDPAKRFRIHVFPGLPEDIDPNTYNIIEILRSFPTTPKEVPQSRRIQRAFDPAGILMFQVPSAAPEKNIKDWKLKILKLGKTER